MATQALRPDICARGTMFFSGACVASGGVLLTILQDRYGFDYELGGTLLAALSVGNLVSAFLTGMLPAYLGDRRTVLLLSAGYMLSFCLMAVSGNPLWLFAAFFLAGIGKGSTLNASNVLAGKAVDRTRSLNLIHAAYALPAVYRRIESDQLERVHVWLCSLRPSAVAAIFAGRAVHHPPDIRTGRQRLELSAQHTLLDSDCPDFLPKLHRNQRDRLDGHLF